MNIFKFIMPALAFLAVLFLVPGTSLAQVKISGAVMGGFGQYSVDPGGTETSTSDLTAEGRAYVDFKGGDKVVSVKLRYRVDEGSGNITATRAEAKWNVSDALSINYMITGFGITNQAYGVYTVPNFGDGMPIGDLYAQAVGHFVNASGVNVQFKTGDIIVGGILLGDCKPTCYDSDDGAITEDSTFVVHFSMGLGDMAFGGFVASASATGSVTGEDPSSSETQFYFTMKTAAFSIAAEIALSDYDTGEAGFKVVDRTGISIGGKAGPISFRYTGIECEQDGQETGCPSSSTLPAVYSEIAVAYTMKLGEKSSFTLGYATYSDDSKGATAGKTLLMTSVKSSF